tara:strand:+ start:218 stop:409 length:192 start_codon:yes stop_codon:yes gene_type:complete
MEKQHTNKEQHQIREHLKGHQASIDNNTRPLPPKLHSQPRGDASYVQPHFDFDDSGTQFHHYY